MKRAFTLVEMLIVVALIATLMTIMFRLGAVSSQDSATNTTILRMAKLENCLSGYYAAYGSYPPVAIHNSRDIYQVVDGHGQQSSGDENKNIFGWTKIGDTEEARAWAQVEAACRAQPVGAEFPFSGDATEDIRDLADTLKKNLQSGDFKNYPKSGTDQYNAVMAGFDSLGGDNPNLGRFNGLENYTSWRKIQLFKFGLMSFLLPRYQLMMGADDDLYTKYAQFTGNNSMPRNPMTGKKYGDWSDVNRLNPSNQKSTPQASDTAQLENIASEAVCVRWLPNLEGICATTSYDLTFYGINVANRYAGSASLLTPNEDPDSYMPSIHFYSPKGESTQDQYILDNLTVQDGWGNEYYYYSPSPHQSYQLWSAGKNGRTFPPWIARKDLNAQENKCVYMWTQDDVKGMKN